MDNMRNSLLIYDMFQLLLFGLIVTAPKMPLEPVNNKYKPSI